MSQELWVIEASVDGGETWEPEEYYLEEDACRTALVRAAYPPESSTRFRYARYMPDGHLPRYLTVGFLSITKVGNDAADAA